jgi:hypothetical protein
MNPQDIPHSEESNHFLGVGTVQRGKADFPVKTQTTWFHTEKAGWLRLVNVSKVWTLCGSAGDGDLVRLGTRRV